MNPKNYPNLRSYDFFMNMPCGKDQRLVDAKNEIQRLHEHTQNLLHRGLIMSDKATAMNQILIKLKCGALGEVLKKVGELIDDKKYFQDKFKSYRSYRQRLIALEIKNERLNNKILNLTEEFNSRKNKYELEMEKTKNLEKLNQEMKDKILALTIDLKSSENYNDVNWSELNQQKEIENSLEKKFDKVKSKFEFSNGDSVQTGDINKHFAGEIPKVSSLCVDNRNRDMEIPISKDNINDSNVIRLCSAQPKSLDSGVKEGDHRMFEDIPLLEQLQIK